MAETVLKEKKGQPPQSAIRTSRADTFTKLYRFRDVNGNPRDITDSEFEFEVRYSKYQNKSDPLIKAVNFIKGQSPAAIDAGVPNDEVLVKVEWEDMDVVSGIWDFDFRETDGSGDRTRRHTGSFILSEDVARKTV